MFIDEMLKDPEFKEEYGKLEPEYQILRGMLEGCEANGLAYSDLPNVTGISKVTIDKLWNCEANPPLSTLKKLASGLNMKIKLEFIRSGV